jgi:pimeloyl-ACP methyl ester carboxylesterase
MPFIEFKSSKIHYVDIDEREDKSKGFSLVFIHGTGSSYSAWDEQLKAFCRSHRVIAIDLSGHGLSEMRDDEKPSIQHGFVQELAALIEKLDLNDFVLIGHSMGGGVAMGYVLVEDFRKPHAMTLVDTHSDLGFSKEMMMGLAIEVAEILLSKTRMRMTHTQSRRHNGEDAILQSLPKSMKTIRRDLEACDQFDITGKLGDIDIPTFILVGEDDDIFPPHVTKSFEEAFSRADIAVVRGADHSPMTQTPDEFNDLLGKFLNWVEKHTLAKDRNS